MISSFRLHNFKSYSTAELKFSPLTMLIGANASGKSNALEALRLLSWLAQGNRLDDIERNIQGADTLIRGQAEDLFQKGHSETSFGCSIWGISLGGIEFDMKIALREMRLVVVEESTRVYSVAESAASKSELPVYQLDSEPSAHTDEVRVEYNNFTRGGRNPHVPCSNRQAIFRQLESPARFDPKHSESQESIPRIARVLRETLSNIVFLDPKPSLMRGYVATKKNDTLEEDGRNLSSVLYQVCHAEKPLNGNPLKEYLLEFVRSLPEQDIADIEFIKTERNDVMVRLVESFPPDENSVVDAPLLSDGTLRVLAVGAMLLTAPEGALVIIEEIDNGIHPSRAKLLMEQMQTIATLRNLQILLTSHNPALLDALPDDALGKVLCCYRDPVGGDSKIVQLRSLEQFSELTAQGPLGHLMTKRILDRFLKNTTTLEERKRKALDWVDGLDDGDAEE